MWNKFLFSQRLATARKAAGFSSQKDFAETYNAHFPQKHRDDAAGNISSPSGIFGTIKNYENENKPSSPQLDKVTNMCSLLGCDVGYLLGDYDEKTWTLSEAVHFTGLKEKSLNLLNSLKDKEFTQVGYSGIKMCEMLDLLLTSPRSYSFFNNLGMALLLRKSSEELTRRSPDEVPLEMEGLAQRGIFALSNDAAASLFLERAADDLKAIVNENGQPTG